MSGINTERPMGVKKDKTDFAVKKKKIEKPVEKPEDKINVKNNEKVIEEKVEDKKNIKVKEKIKKDTAIVNGKNLPISTKTAVFICRAIKGKKIDLAINYLTDVINMKKAVPFGTEVPHRKGHMGPGRYPQRAAGEILVLVKSLKANSEQNSMEEPIIEIAMANKAQSPYGKKGQVRRKRTHVTLIAKEKKMENKK